MKKFAKTAYFFLEWIDNVDELEIFYNMASGVHTLSLSPQDNILISDSLVYSSSSEDEFPQFVETQNYAQYYNSDSFVYANVPLNATPHHKMVNCNNNNLQVQNFERGYFKSTESSNSPQDYESDESSISYSSRDITHKGIKLKNFMTAKDTLEQYGMYNQPCLYQPNVYLNKNR